MKNNSQIIYYLFVSIWVILVFVITFAIISILFSTPSTDQRIKEAEETAKIVQKCKDLGLEAGQTISGVVCVPSKDGK